MASPPQSIRRRLMTMMMLTSAASIGLMSSAFIAYEFIAARDQNHQQLATLARIVAGNSTAALAFRAEEDAHEVLASLRTEPQIMAAALFDERGRLFARYPRSAATAVFPAAPARDGFVFSADRLEGFQTVSELPGRPLGVLFIRADMQPVYQRFQAYGLIALATTLASLLLAYALSRFFERRLSRPILSLADTARAVSELYDYAVRAPPAGEAELAVLTTAFNQMLERIDAQNSELRDSETRLKAVLKSAQAQLARLDLLQRTTRAIADRQDLSSIYRVILSSLEQDLPIAFGCMCQYDADVRAPTVVSIADASAPYAALLDVRLGARLPVDEAILARCLSGVLVYEPNVGETPFVFAQRLAAAGLHSLVAAPLMIENRLFGVLLVARSQADAFSSGDCEFLRQLSEHVALAAHQVQLHTALQGAYDELRQSQQIILQQERLRALGQMASGVAHDINNAISPIALYTESLLEHEPHLSERAREYLRIIQRAIEDVAQTVAKMREFYRRRDQAADLQPVSVNPLVEQVLQSTRARWCDMPQERGLVIEVRTELEPEAPAILGAESDIRDALTNLIFNAVDAMPEGGQLLVRTRRRIADCARESLELEIVDSGVGMDEETRRRCLEPFFTTKGERGTGMGLAMVYGMVRRHGAEIEVDSAPGAGTTVRLRFPAATSAVAELLPTQAASSRPLHILIVDDDPLVLESLRRTLNGEGHSVEASDGGQAGLDRFHAALREDAAFDVVITDLGMPVVDGRAVAAAVKAISPDTPVLLLTGWGERLQTEQSIPTHVDRVLSKPPRMADLRRALADLTSASASERATARPRRMER